MPYTDPEARRAARREYTKRAEIHAKAMEYQRKYRLAKFGPSKPKLTEEERKARRADSRKKWYDARGKEYHEAWRAANPEKVQASLAKTTKEANRERERRWVRSNPGRAAAKTYRYRATKRNALPKWVTQEEHDQITALYAEAKRLSDLTNIQFHVDHVLPLQGKTVCGLHVLSNLQILPYYANIAKGNRVGLTD